MGGAINVISARPEFETSGYANLRYVFGNEQLQAQAVANVELSDQIAVRVGIDNVVQNDGFFTNDFLGEVLDRNDSTGVRGQIRWKSDRTDLVLRGEHSQGFLPAINYRISIAPRTGFPLGYIQPERTYPYGSSSFSKQEINNSQISLSHDFEGAMLRSITNYRQRITEFQSDSDGLNRPLLDQLVDEGIITINQDPDILAITTERTRFFTQDMHLFGATFSDRLNWLVGLEYLNVKSNSERRNLRTPTVSNPSPGSLSPDQTTLESWAIYGSLDYKIVDSLNLIGEIRQTWDNKSAISARFDLATGLPSGGPGFIVDFAKKVSNFSYNGTLSWRLADQFRIYGKIGSSYRAGGFNRNLGVPEQPVVIPAIFDDEQNTSFEIGLRSRIAGAIDLAAALYQTNSQDVIVQLNNGCFVGNAACSSVSVSFADNSGSGRIRGAEAEATATLRLGSGTWKWSASLSYQDGKITEGPYDGQSLPKIPRWLFGIDSTIRQPLGGGANLTVNANYNGQRGGVHDLVLPGATFQAMDRIDQLNTRIAMDWDGVEFAIFANNLTDETYDIFRAPSSRRLNSPRSWGVQLGFRW